mmetsp:Transcript_857/g.1741  ORF Transcript_857/g.1741 Transcript_857/m.1741 type:complete len:227 (-) Transcript_857:279-959(-)
MKLLPVRPERQLLEHARRRVAYRCGREIGGVLGTLADTEHHVRYQPLAARVSEASVHGSVVGEEHPPRRACGCDSGADRGARGGRQCGIHRRGGVRGRPELCAILPARNVHEWHETVVDAAVRIVCRLLQVGHVAVDVPALRRRPRSADQHAAHQHPRRGCLSRRVQLLDDWHRYGHSGFTHVLPQWVPLRHPEVPPQALSVRNLREGVVLLDRVDRRFAQLVDQR